MTHLHDNICICSNKDLYSFSFPDLTGADLLSIKLGVAILAVHTIAVNLYTNVATRDTDSNCIVYNLFSLLII